MNMLAPITMQASSIKLSNHSPRRMKTLDPITMQTSSSKPNRRRCCFNLDIDKRKLWYSLSSSASTSDVWIQVEAVASICSRFGLCQPCTLRSSILLCASRDHTAFLRSSRNCVRNGLVSSSTHWKKPQPKDCRPKINLDISLLLEEI